VTIEAPRTRAFGKGEIEKEKREEGFLGGWLALPQHAPTSSPLTRRETGFGMPFQQYKHKEMRQRKPSLFVSIIWTSEFSIEVKYYMHEYDFERTI
jgi:hypothetical protein